MKRTPRFSRTMPSDAAKKARMCLMKCFSSSLSLVQCTKSSERSTSSAVREGGEAGESETTVRGKISRIAERWSEDGRARVARRVHGKDRCGVDLGYRVVTRWDVPVQKEASAFLYISQMSPYLMGNMVKRSSLASRRGSATRATSLLLDSATMVR